MRDDIDELKQYAVYCSRSTLIRTRRLSSLRYSLHRPANGAIVTLGTPLIPLVAQHGCTFLVSQCLHLQDEKGALRCTAPLHALIHIISYPATVAYLGSPRPVPLTLLARQQVDCITVSLFPFKASIEDQLQRLADALTLSLRNSVLSNFKAIDTFLEDSMDKLGRRPRTINDISEV